MHRFSVVNSSYSQSPYFVLQLHPTKCISNWSFNSELCTVIQTAIYLLKEPIFRSKIIIV